MNEAIGGFFALENLPAHRHPLLQHWTPPDSVATVFRHNARSALKARLTVLGCQRLWLPAYSCQALAEAVPDSASLHFYPQNENLQLDLAHLSAQLCPDDVVVVINYFGAPPARQTLDWRQTRSDIHWIEDRAHTLAAGDRAWGDDVLYSPRKLCGVPDGGLLFARKHEQAIPAEPHLQPPDDVATAALLRLQAGNEIELAVSYRHYQQQELAMRADDRAISELTLQLLRAIPWRAQLLKRRQNYRHLQHHLSHYSFLGAARHYTPSHFVIRHRQARSLAQRLQAVGIFAQHHWQQLAAPSMFTEAYELSTQLLSLPCDHRYGIEHMEKICRALAPWL